MQQFAANARNQSRPPLALFSFCSDGVNVCRSGGEEEGSRRNTVVVGDYGARASSHCTTAAATALLQQRLASSVAYSSSSKEVTSESATAVSSDDDKQQQHLSTTTQQFQQLIASRRTVSNFASRPQSEQPLDRQFLRDAITRAVECAVTAPNHRLTEPTTFHRILSPSAASDRLVDITYEVTLQRLLNNKLSGEEACRSEAARKREKWLKVPAFVVATVKGVEWPASEEFDGCLYSELPQEPLTTIQQIEDYASACASIQNLLLSLHAEGLGSKWATGPVIKTVAFRELVGLERDDMVVGLIMVGWPKRLPRMRRRRAIEGDVLIDVGDV